MSTKLYLSIFCLLLLWACSNTNKHVDPAFEKEISQLKTAEEKQHYLENIWKDDQAVRNPEKSSQLVSEFGFNSKEHLAFAEAQWAQDEINLQKIEIYLKHNPYPSTAKMGMEAATAPWLVIHHQTDLKTRNRFFKILYGAYLNGDIDEDALSFYLGRTYEFQFGERFYMPSPYRPQDEIDQLVDKLNLDKEKEEVELHHKGL